MGEDLFSSAGTHVLAIGVGRVGGEAASAGALADAGGDSLPRALWAAADSEAAQLIATGLEHKLHVPLARGAFAAKSAVQGVAACEGELAAACSGKNVALVFGAADEEAVAAILPELAKDLRRRDLPVCALLAGVDAAFENGASCRADTADVTLCIPPCCDGAASLGLAWGGGRQLLARKLLAAVQALAGVFSQSGRGGFSVETLREVLRGGGPILAAVGQAGGPAAVPRAFALAAEEAAAYRGPPDREDRAITEALNGKARDEALDLAVAVLAGSEPSRAEVRDVARHLGRYATRRAPLVGFQRHADLDDEAICLFMLRHSASRNVVALMSA